MFAKTFALLCLKYPNHPRKLRLRSSQIVRMFRPSVRRVFWRIVSLSLSMLFLRGHFIPRSNDSPESRTLRLNWHSPAVFWSGAVAGRFLPPSAVLVLRPLGLLVGCGTAG